MGTILNHITMGAFTLFMVSACGSNVKHMNVSAPLPPLSDTQVGVAELQQINPANGLAFATSVAPAQSSCRFSSFQRKHTLGYEFDESRHIFFKVSPSFDIWDPSEFDTKVSLRFTKAIGGPANKRPDCTYASGFYGLIPYASNEGINIGGLFDNGNIKSFVEDKLDAREKRRKEQESQINI